VDILDAGRLEAKADDLGGVEGGALRMACIQCPMESE